MMHKKKSIFLIEDDEDDQTFFIEALGEIENTVLYAIARDGEDALRQLETLPTLPDIIFLDINMPVMNGIECLIALKSTLRIKGIPVVMLTTSTREMKATHRLGAQAYIEKPSNGKLLRQKIEQMINLDFAADSHIGDYTFRNMVGSSYLSYKRLLHGHWIKINTSVPHWSIA